MNQIIKQNRLFTSITKGKNRNKSKLHPRSSSVTVSQIRLKKNKIIFQIYIIIFLLYEC